jgi:hypothetical protein
LSGVTTAFNLRCPVAANEITPGRSFFIELRRGGSVSTVPLPIARP